MPAIIDVSQIVIYISIYIVVSFAKAREKARANRYIHTAAVVAKSNPPWKLKKSRERMDAE